MLDEANDSICDIDCFWTKICLDTMQIGVNIDLFVGWIWHIIIILTKNPTCLHILRMFLITFIQPKTCCVKYKFDLFTRIELQLLELE